MAAEVAASAAEVAEVAASKKLPAAVPGTWLLLLLGVVERGRPRMQLVQAAELQPHVQPQV